MKFVHVLVFFAMVLSVSGRPTIEDRMDRMEAAMASLLQHFGQTTNTELTESDAINFRNDTNLEERVQVLEFQMTEVQEDVVDLDTQVSGVLTGQVTQDQRILELETETTELESNVNSLVSSDINILNTVNGLDTRVGNLEFEGTVAFHATLLAEFPVIPDETVVVFGNVNVNLGSSYNGETGEFTVPSGGAGLYYFYVHVEVDNNEVAVFNIRHNGIIVCDAQGDGRNAAQWDSGSCGAVIAVQDGDIVAVYKEGADDDTPVSGSIDTRSTFTGFRVAPQ